MPQENNVLNQALQQPVKKENLDLGKIDNQKTDTPDTQGVPDEVMEMLDKGMSEISETTDLNGSLKNLITKLQGLVKEDKPVEKKVFTRQELSTY